MPDRWLKITGWPYEVSDKGDVRSIRSGKLLKPETDRDGYKKVTLCLDGKRLRRFVHYFVLTAFVGPRPDGHECAHSNGLPGDNNLKNLRWATRSENNQDKHKHGTMPIAETHGMAKLTWDDVREIRRRLLDGETCSSLADRFGVDKSSVSNIARGRSWEDDTWTPMRFVEGEKHRCAKLTAEKVRESRRRNSSGESIGVLAKEMGVDWKTMQYAIAGKTWVHV